MVLLFVLFSEAGWYQQTLEATTHTGGLSAAGRRECRRAAGGRMPGRLLKVRREEETRTMGRCRGAQSAGKDASARIRGRRHGLEAHDGPVRRIQRAYANEVHREGEETVLGGRTFQLR